MKTRGRKECVRTHRPNHSGASGGDVGRAAQARLEPDHDLPTLAAEAGYRVKTLAARLGCSTRQLERYWHQHFGTAPKRRLDQLRLGPSLPLLLRGERVKLVAAELGFGAAADFSRAFKRHYGVPPRAFAAAFADLATSALHPPNGRGAPAVTTFSMSRAPRPIR